MKSQDLILGAGMTGLAAGWASGLRVYEAAEAPGGICSSYYMRPGERGRFHRAPDDGEAYRFEIGGGHWIFGGDPVVLRFLSRLAPVKSYRRRSSVIFPLKNLCVPYPLQNHLGYLDEEIRVSALTEMLTASGGNPTTMEEWLNQNFGPTLTRLFFGPFHELYTAGLWRTISPQDAYKSPADIVNAIRGAAKAVPPVGYNVTYIYPKEGLNALAQRMAERVDVRYRKEVKQIHAAKHEVLFGDGSGEKFDWLISTLPLNRVMEMAGLETDEKPDPYTSVLVLNIGATRGAKCPEDHWIYVPGSEAGFHRVGFYSNVDSSFLPRSSQTSRDRLSVYVERAFKEGQKPSESQMLTYSAAVVEELQKWEFIGQAEVVDPTWIDVAYSWSWPNSRWRSKALRRLEESNIIMIGRYARWVFQGIADSIRDGLFVGATFRNAD